MKTRIKNYVNDLFADIYETRQLLELKEEICSNLLEKIRDLIGDGYGENEAFNRAISDLGDMGELIEGLKGASEQKMCEDMYERQPLSKKHIIGYTVASAILLFGIMVSSIVYFDANDLLFTIGTFMPFLIISAGLFVYFGLTQETQYIYGMGKKRATGYSLATMVSLLGIILTALTYMTGTEISGVLGTFMVFVVPSVIAFIYLGLTEKNRSKLDWGKEWIKYYSDPKKMMVYANISGALWIFAFGATPLIGFKLGWKYAWIPFIVASGGQLIIEAIFASRKE